MTHWTQSEGGFEHFLVFDLLTHLELVAEGKGGDGPLSKRELSSLNSPEKMTLGEMVKLASSLGVKVGIIVYDDNDPHNEEGPIPSGVFLRCWERMGKPRWEGPGTCRAWKEGKDDKDRK